LLRNDKDKLRIAVVGLGKMGMLHASILSFMSNVGLTAVCDKSQLMRKVAKNTLKGPLVTDELTDLQKLSLDVLYVTTPIPSHYGILKQALTQNIAPNLFVEKTLTRSPAESSELSTLAKEHHSITMVGYMKRFSVTFKKAKDLISQGKLGELRSFEAYAYSSDFEGVDKASASPSRGGVLKDLGSHVVDIALWFFGDLSVTSVIKSSPNSSDLTNCASFEVGNSENNLAGTFRASWIESGYRMPEFGFIINGSKGVLTVDDSKVNLKQEYMSEKIWYRQDLADNVPFLIGEPEYFRENESFISSILNGVEVEPNFHTALKVDNLLGEVERKANEK
jgi:predicted dehydrogenase